MKNSIAANMGFAIAGVPCFADTFVQGGGSVLRMKFSAKTPRHRKPPKRYITMPLRYINTEALKKLKQKINKYGIKKQNKNVEHKKHPLTLATNREKITCRNITTLKRSQKRIIQIFVQAYFHHLNRHSF